jgi:hypothetical protein
VSAKSLGRTHLIAACLRIADRQGFGQLVSATTRHSNNIFFLPFMRTTFLPKHQYLTSISVHISTLLALDIPNPNSIPNSSISCPFLFQVYLCHHDTIEFRERLRKSNSGIGDPSSTSRAAVLRHAKKKLSKTIKDLYSGICDCDLAIFIRSGVVMS